MSKSHSLPSLAGDQARRGGTPNQGTVSGRLAPSTLPRCAQTGMPKHLELWKKEAKQLRRRIKTEELGRLNFHGHAGDVEGFRAFLTHRYGGSVRGWRLGMAPDKYGVRSAAFNEFNRGLKRMGYSGNALSLWREMSRGEQDAVGLEDLEPDLAAQLDQCSRRLLDRFRGGAAEAWESLQRDHAKRATFREFGAFCDQQELAAEGEALDVRRIFAALDLTGRGLLTLEDLRFFDHWASWRFGVPVIPEREPRRDTEELHWSPPPREERAGPGLEDFRGYLEQNFGSLARAWRTALDLKGEGDLGPADFGKGCRSAGWRHPHGPIWRELNGIGNGFVTLRALDPGSAEALDRLNEAVAREHGDTQTFWNEVVDPGGTGVISRTEFISDACRKIGVGPADARRVFAALDTANTGWVAVSEIGFLEAFQRGEAARNADPLAAGHSTSDSAQFSVSAPPAVGKNVSWNSAWGSSVGPNSQGGGQASQMAQSSQMGQSAHSNMGSLAQTSRTQGTAASFSTQLSGGSSAFPPRPKIWAPALSTRSVQRRLFAHTHSLKHRWLKDAVLDQCSYGSHEALQTAKMSATQNKTFHSSSKTDVFRSTNSLYREGMRKLMEAQDVGDAE